MIKVGGFYQYDNQYYTIAELRLGEHRLYWFMDQLDMHWFSNDSFESDLEEDYICEYTSLIKLLVGTL